MGKLESCPCWIHPQHSTPGRGGDEGCPNRWKCLDVCIRGIATRQGCAQKGGHLHRQSFKSIINVSIVFQPGKDGPCLSRFNQLHLTCHELRHWGTVATTSLSNFTCGGGKWEQVKIATWLLRKTPPGGCARSGELRWSSHTILG